MILKTLLVASAIISIHVSAAPASHDVVYDGSSGGVVAAVQCARRGA